MRVELAIAVRAPCDGEVSAPSSCWQRRVRGGKLSVSADHEDFPALLAEALDTLHHLSWDVGAAAERLHCSNSQLIKLLKLDHRALQQLNAAREALGLKQLK